MLELFQVAKSHSVKRDGRSVRGFLELILSDEPGHLETRKRPNSAAKRLLLVVRLAPRPDMIKRASTWLSV